MINNSDCSILNDHPISTILFNLHELLRAGIGNSSRLHTLLYLRPDDLLLVVDALLVEAEHVHRLRVQVADSAAEGHELGLRGLRLGLLLRFHVVHRLLEERWFLDDELLLQSMRSKLRLLSLFHLCLLLV